MVQFFNPPPSAFEGNRPFKSNQLASALTAGIQTDSQANAINEVLSAKNPAFRTLPPEEQARISNALALGSRDAQRAGLRIQDGFQDPKASPLAMILSSVLGNDGNLGKVLSNIAGAASSGNTITSGGNDTTPDGTPAAASSISQADAALANDVPFVSTGTRDAALFKDSSIDLTPIQGRGVSTPSGPVSRNQLNNVSKAAELSGEKIDPQEILQEAKKRKIPASQVIKEIAEALGMTDEQLNARFSSTSGSF